MKVTVFGTGYVGLVQGAVLASVGHDVVCVDIDKTKVDNLNQGVIPIFEPGLEKLVVENADAGWLIFTADSKKALAHGEIIFIAVGTPSNEDGSADLHYVMSVSESIASQINDYKIIVNKSTVPVGTAQKVKDSMNQVLAKRALDIELDVVSNPEFLKEGSAVSDCQSPDRIIIGTSSQRAEDKMRELYAPFNRNHEKIMVMDIRSAELTKYAANCMLSTKISFMNEMANIAELVGADIESVRKGIGSDPRIGYQFIYPGCGYGGACFPKDIKALINTAEENDYHPEILKAVENTNQTQKNKLFSTLSKHFNHQLSGKTIAIWGLSYKPNTDDMREAPSKILIEALLKANVKIQAFDPIAMESCRKIYGDRVDLQLTETKEQALDRADALVICTDWNHFKAPDFELIANSLVNKVIIDGRNLFDPKMLKSKDFVYYAFGRGDSIIGSGT